MLFLKFIGYLGLALIIGLYILLIVGIGHLSAETMKELKDKK